MVLAHSGYFYCTCKLLFQDTYPPQLVDEKLK